jgi:hypothetical protein
VPNAIVSPGESYMVDVQWEQLHWKDLSRRYHFDERVTLASRQGKFSDQHVKFLFGMACQTSDKGWHVDLYDHDPSLAQILAEAARALGGAVGCLMDADSQRSRESGPYSAVWKELEQSIDIISEENAFVAKARQRGIGLLSVCGGSLVDKATEIVANLKDAISLNGIVLFSGAEDRGRVDATIDRLFCTDYRFVEIQALEGIRAFRRHDGAPTMILCSGLQSGGTTLVSWCFLQRPDMDGILDMWGDRVELMPYVDARIGWCKMTVAAFRWQDVADFYSDMGWTVQPLLVVRDVRAAYASLRKKFWAINGLTAEDTPFRIRLKRFLRDWEQFRANGWPIIRFESMLADPQGTLMQTCAKLHIPWDPAMMRWPKARDEIAGVDVANETFKGFLSGRGLHENMDSGKEREPKTVNIPSQDMKWLSDSFKEYNDENDYPLELGCGDSHICLDRPSYTPTANYRRSNELRQAKNMLSECRDELETVLNSKSWKLTWILRRGYDSWKRMGA